MSKRYVFWRQPDGKPYRRDDNKHAPTALLAKVGESATVSPNGLSFPFPSTPVHDSDLVRATAIVLDPEGDEVNDNDASTIVWEGIRAEITRLGGGKPILPHDVLLSADKCAAAHFRKPMSDYALLTTLARSS